MYGDIAAIFSGTKLKRRTYEQSAADDQTNDPDEQVGF